MAVTFALGLRGFCVALGLLLATARAADPVSPLIGVTRDQLLSRYGEPKSQMTAGNRVIYLYPRERVVLRDNVVVEVEPIAGDNARRGPSDGATTPGSETSPPPSQPTSTPPPNDSLPPAVRPVNPVAPAPPTPDSKVEIKLVRPPSAKDSRPATPEAPRTTPLPIPVELTPVIPVSVAPKNSTVDFTAPAKKTLESTIKVDQPASMSGAARGSESVAVPSDAEQKRDAAKKKEEVKKATAPQFEPPPPAEPSDGMFGSRIFLMAGAVLVGGVLLLIWRYRQRQFVLAATSVVNTPLSTTPAPAFTGGGFTAEELNKLEWKRFEELVTAYYSKTGVVAVRTKTGPDSPVHIKISWKGEPRPFAYVQCIAHPSGLIDGKPLQALVAALAADNIRRGYVVTSGKFNVQARDFAEEKHLTLLPADLFLEKLNALPSAARAEIAQSISAKDSNVAGS